MIDRYSTYKCDKKGCEVTAETGEYSTRPDGWVVIHSDPRKNGFHNVHGHDGVRQFCSPAHAASFLALEAAKLARTSEAVDENHRTAELASRP